MSLQEARLLSERHQQCQEPITWAQVPVVPAVRSLMPDRKRAQWLHFIGNSPPKHGRVRFGAFQRITCSLGAAWVVAGTAFVKQLPTASSECNQPLLRGLRAKLLKDLVMLSAMMPSC